MKLLSDLKIANTITGNANPLFPLTNLKTYDPSEVWQGTSTSETIVLDFGTATNFNCVFLDNANFTGLTAKFSNNSDGSSPVTTKTVTLSKDDLKVYKAFVKLDATVSCRYIVLNLNSVLTGQTAIKLGLILAGVCDDVKVSGWNPRIEDVLATFVSDGGNYSEKRKGRSRHIINVSFSGTKADLDNLDLNFDRAVIYTDLTNIADCYFIGIPQQRSLQINESILACVLSCQLSEFV